MRVPIVEYPEIVRQNVPQFEPIFANKNQVKHFCEYVTGLIAGNKATIQAINALFLNKNDQSALNKFLTQAAWDEAGLNQRRVQFELERLQRRPVSASAGRLIIDDTYGFLHGRKYALRAAAVVEFVLHRRLVGLFRKTLFFLFGHRHLGYIRKYLYTKLYAVFSVCQDHILGVRNGGLG